MAALAVRWNPGFWISYLLVVCVLSGKCLHSLWGQGGKVYHSSLENPPPLHSSGARPQPFGQPVHTALSLVRDDETLEEHACACTGFTAWMGRSPV